MFRLLISLSAVALTSSTTTIEPGNWEAVSQLEDIRMGPDAPPGMADIMRSTLGDGITVQTCVTQEQIDQGPETMFNQTGGDCSYSEFSMADGVLHSAAQCRGPQGEMNMTTDGTYTATAYSTRMVMESDMGMGPMTMIFAVEGRRLGAC